MRFAIGGFATTVFALLAIATAPLALASPDTEFLDALASNGLSVPPQPGNNEQTEHHHDGRGVEKEADEGGGAGNVCVAPPAVDELTYFNRLEKPNPPVEKLKPVPDKGRPAPAQVVSSGSPPAPPLPAATETASPAGTPSPSQGYAVQIAALNVRSEADAMAKRLASKGYAAYVLTPANGTPAVYRVRIGTFRTRREAEAMAARLQKEEQFKPWITK